MTSINVIPGYRNVSTAEMLSLMERTEQMRDRTRFLLYLPVLRCDKSGVFAPIDAAFFEKLYVSLMDPKKVSTAFGNQVQAIEATHKHIADYMKVVFDRSPAPAEISNFCAGKNEDHLNIAARMLTHEYLKLLKVEFEEYKRQLIVNTERADAGNPIADADLPKRIKTYISLTAAYRWIVPEGTELNVAPSVQRPRQTPLTIQTSSHGRQTPEMQKRRTPNTPIMSASYVYGMEAYSPVPGIQSSIDERRIIHQKGPFEDVSPRSETSVKSPLPNLFTIIGGGLPNMANLKIEYHENGQPCFRACNEVIKPQFKLCSIHSGNGITNLPILSQEKLLFFRGAYGYRDKRGNCYDICYSFRQTPMDQSELSHIVSYADKLSEDINAFKDDANEVVRIMGSINSMLDEKKVIFNSINTQHESLREMSRDGETTNEIIGFMNKGIFERLPEVHTTIKRKKITKYVQQTPNVVNGQIYSSFFGVEDDLFKTIERVGVQFFFGIPSHEDEVPEFQNLPVVFDSETAKRILTLLEDFDYRHSGYVPLEIKNDDDRFFLLNNNGESVVISKSVLYSIATSLKCKVDDLIDSVILLEARPSYDVVVLGQGNNTISSYETNCYNAGFSYLTKVGFSQIFAADYGDGFRMFVKPWEKCVDIGAALLGDNTLFFNRMTNPQFFPDSCCFNGKIKLPLTREFVDAVESLSSTGITLASIPSGRLEINVINIGEIEGNTVCVAANYRTTVLSTVRNDVAKLGVIDDENEDEDADSKFTILDLRSFPICNANFDFLFTNLFADIAYDSDGNYDHVQNPRDFILAGLLSGYNLDTRTSEINLKTQFSKNHTVRLSNRSKTTVPFIKICTCNKLVSTINDIKEIDRMTICSLQTMIEKTGVELLTGMFNGYTNSSGGFQSTIDNRSFDDHIYLAKRMIEEKLVMKGLLEDVNHMIESSMIEYECSINSPAGFYDRFKNVCFFVDSTFERDVLINDSALPQVPFYTLDKLANTTSFIPQRAFNSLLARYPNEFLTAISNLGTMESTVLNADRPGVILLRYIFPENRPIFISDIMPKAGDIMTATCTLPNMPSFFNYDETEPQLFRNMVDTCRLNAACTLASALADVLKLERLTLENIIDKCDELIEAMVSGKKIKLPDVMGILDVEATTFEGAIDLCIIKLINIFSGVGIDGQPIDEMFIDLMTIDFDVIRPYRLRRALMREFLSEVLGFFKLDFVKRSNTGVFTHTLKPQFDEVESTDDVRLSIISANLKAYIQGLDLKPTCIYDKGRETDIHLLPLTERLMIANLLIPETIGQSNVSTIAGVVATYCITNHPEIFESRFYYRYSGLKYTKSALVANNFSSIFGGEDGLLDFKTKVLKCEEFRDLLKNTSASNNSTISEYNNINSSILTETGNLTKTKNSLQGRFINKAAVINSVLRSYKKVKTDNTKFTLKLKVLEDVQTSFLRRLAGIDLPDIKTLLAVYESIDIFYRMRKDLYVEFKLDDLSRFNRIFDAGTKHFEKQFVKIDTSLSISRIVHQQIDKMDIELMKINENCSIHKSVTANLNIVDRIDVESQDNIMKMFVSKECMTLLGVNFQTFYDMTTKDKLEDITIEDFPNARKMDGFYDILNSGTEQQFSANIVDVGTKMIFNEQKDTVSKFIVAVLDALTVIDCGPGMHFMVEFLKTSLDYDEQLEMGSDEIYSLRIRLNEIKARLKAFVNLDNLKTTGKLPSFISVINGTFSSFANYTSNLPGLSNYNLEMPNVTEDIVKNLIQLIDDFSLDEYNNCDAFDLSLREAIDKITPETFRDAITCFARYIDEYIGKMGDEEIVLNDELVLELRDIYVLKSRGTCLNTLFLNCNRYLNSLISRGRNELSKSVVGVFKEYIINMTAGFNSIPSLESFIISRYV